MDSLAVVGTKNSFAIPTYSEKRGQAVMLTLRAAIAAATINLLWNGYHYRGTQSGINCGYVMVLFATEDAAQKGIVADNVAATRSLSRDVQGNLEDSIRTLTELQAQKEVLTSQISSLGVEVSHLKKTHEEFKTTLAALEKVKEEMNLAVKTLSPLKGNNSSKSI